MDDQDQDQDQESKDTAPTSDDCEQPTTCTDVCYPNDDYLINKYIDTNFRFYKKVPCFTYKKYKTIVKDNFHFFFKTNDFWLWLIGACLYLLTIMISFSVFSIFMKFFKQGGREYRHRIVFLCFILFIVLLVSHKLDL